LLIEQKESSDSSVNTTIDYEKNNFTSVEKVKQLSSEIKTLIVQIEILRGEFENNPTTPKKKQIEEKVVERNKKQNELIKYEESTSNTIKVTTFLTKNETKTKTEKIFTITENGVQ